MGFATYMRGVDQAVEHTPPERNRAADAWRVIALLVVVIGHWLAASVWVQADGNVLVLNTLEWIPYAAWATWIVQVMPIFFFVGGFSNARALEKHHAALPIQEVPSDSRRPRWIPSTVFFFVGGFANARAIDRKRANRRTWIVGRFRRLFTPAVPLILTWTILALVLSPFIDPDLVYAGVLNATIPVWFLAVYLVLIAVAPLTYAWWRRSGWVSVATLGLIAVLIDVANIGFDVPGVGWLNYLFVWSFVHQLGYAWATADSSRKLIPTAFGLGLAAISLAALIALTTLGWYPVAMVTIPGGGPNNITPPTMAVGILALVQIGIILASSRVTGRFASRPKAWRWVVAVSGLMMTIYLWHLTSLSLVTAVGIFALDGVFFSIEPGTALWWTTRPLFDLVLAAGLAILIAIFGRFEIDINTSFQPMSRRFVTIGLVTTIIALTGTAFAGIVTRDGTINWWIPITAIVAAGLIGAYPASWSRDR
jgi:hypothetical protein